MKLSPTVRESLERAAERYAETLTSNPMAMAFLEKRGIPEKVAASNLLGYVDDPVIGHDQYAGMLSIPYLSPSGVVGLKFRHLSDDHKPRYQAAEGGGTRLFNVMAFHRSTKTISVCEGELDTIILDNIVGIPAVGVPGVNTWKPHHPRIFEGYQQVFIFADNDSKDDGSNPGLELAKRIIRDVPQAVMVGLPKGKDVNDCFLDPDLGSVFLESLIVQ